MTGICTNFVLNRTNNEERRGVFNELRATFHNPEVEGSSPSPATTFKALGVNPGAFVFTEFC